MTQNRKILYSEQRGKPGQIDRWLALGGVIGPLFFVLTFTIAGLLRPAYSPIKQAVSDLGVGDNGWILNGSLVQLCVNSFRVPAVKTAPTKNTKPTYVG